jgi:hypothetical protein
MANTEATAKRWMQWLLEREEIPFRASLAPYFANPTFSRLCDCGCNSFDLAMTEKDLPLLCAPGERGGMFFELDYELTEDRQLEFLFFVDKAGRLTGVDIEVSGNNFPVPESPQIGKLTNVRQSRGCAP